MRRTRFALLLAGLLAAGAAEAARVVDVRVGVQSGGQTRIVLELDAPARYTISQQEIPGAAGPVAELMVELDATGSFAAAGQPGLVDSVRVKAQGQGAVALIRLKTASPRITDMALENPHRIVIDVARSGDAAKPPAPAAAEPAAPAKSEPAAPAEPAAKRAPSTIVGTAPPSTALGSEPTAVVAQAEPAGPAPDAEAAAPPEAQPPAETPEPAAAPAPTEAPATAAEPAPDEPAAPAPPPRPTPPASEPAAKPSPPEPPAPEPPASALDQVMQALRSDPRLVGIAGAVILLFVIWRLLARRARAAARARRRPDFPPLPPIEGLAPSLEDEPEIVGRVREEPAAPPEEDELPALKTGKRVGWREPLPGVTPREPAPPAPAAAEPVSPAEPEPRPAFAAGAPTPPHVEPAPAPPPAFEEPSWGEREPDLLAAPGEPEQASLWGEGGAAEPPEIESSAALEPHPAEFEPTPAVPHAPPSAPATAKLESEVRELERRLRHLETRLEEATEARDRLERQLAANSEELRVQRSAIARTQRVVRTLMQPEGQPKDPTRSSGG